MNYGTLPVSERARFHQKQLDAVGNSEAMSEIAKLCWETEELGQKKREAKFAAARLLRIQQNQAEAAKFGQKQQSLVRNRGAAS